MSKLTSHQPLLHFFELNDQGKAQQVSATARASCWSQCEANVKLISFVRAHQLSTLGGFFFFDHLREMAGSTVGEGSWVAGAR